MHAQVKGENPATKMVTNIARCISNAMDVDNVANARLIASAPDLLSQLTLMVELFSASGMYDDEVFIDARAAIARATGADQ